MCPMPSHASHFKEDKLKQMKTGLIIREIYLQPFIKSCELIVCCKATIFILQWLEKNKYILHINLVLYEPNCLCGVIMFK
jgi:hypothetical protein